jgi:hypothetical protein
MASGAGVPETSLFGLLVSGRPVSTDFLCVAPGARYTATVAQPCSAPTVSLFLLPGRDFPPGVGITVMSAMPPFTDWSPLGVLTPDKPSATFRTGWPALAAGAAAPAAAMLGLAVEPLDAVASVGVALDAADADRLAFAQLVARDLCAFLSSFAQSTAGGEKIVMPAAAVNTWLDKFTQKFRRDPHFLLKSAL